MLAIDKILDAIHNGEWHEIKEVTGKTKLKESQIELISGFLAAYDFLELDRKSRRIRLSPQLRHFLDKIHEIEKGEAPDKKNLSVSSIFFS